RRSRRRTLGLYVYADGRVEVRAPLNCAQASIEAFVRARADWIRRQRAYFAARPQPVRPSFGNGETHPFLGRHYPLRLQRAARARTCLEGGALHVHATDIDRPEQVERRLLHWYRRQAQELFAPRLALGVRAMQGYGIAMPELKIRRMTSRWGSCARRGAITLNLELIKHPVSCIDYVIAHELCHLLEFNHSPRFYALL